MTLPDKPPELTMPLPTVLVFKCLNPPRAKFTYLAAFEQKARGELITRVADVENRYGVTTNIVNQWIGETEEEAKEKAILWWYETFDLHSEVIRKGSASLGLVWVNKKSTGERYRLKAEQVDEYLANGFKTGKLFVD